LFGQSTPGVSLFGPYSVSLLKVGPFVEVIFVKDMLYAVLALVSAVIAAFTFYKYTASDDNKLFLVVAIVFILATIVLGGLFLSGRVNKDEDIHITE
jgi:hypothetical protein